MPGRRIFCMDMVKLKQARTLEFRFSCTYDDPTKLAISVGVRGPGQTSVVSSSSFISIQTTGNDERRQTPMLDPTRLASDEEPGRQKARGSISQLPLYSLLSPGGKRGRG